MLDRQPALAHPQLLLRPAVAADWPALFAAANDPGIWEGHPAHDRRDRYAIQHCPVASEHGAQDQRGRAGAEYSGRHAEVDP